MDKPVSPCFANAFWPRCKRQAVSTGDAEDPVYYTVSQSIVQSRRLYFPEYIIGVNNAIMCILMGLDLLLKLRLYAAKG